MTSRLLHFLLITHIIILFLPTNCDRKSRKTFPLPHYPIHKSNSLPRDAQVTIFVQKDIPTRYYYKSESESSLSVTLTPCSSPVRWTMTISQSNKTDTNPITLTYTMDTQSFPVYNNGIYILQIEGIEMNTFVNVYISTEEDGPETLQHSKDQKLRLLSRQKKKRLTVKWNHSLVDPQGTEYCLVVSTERHYESLCSAQSYGYGINAIEVYMPTVYQNLLNSHDHRIHPEPRIICVGRKTQFTLQNLSEGVNYFYDLFAINHQSNFTYPFGSEMQIFHSNNKPITLKDGKSSFANLRKLDGKAVFRFKIGKKSGNFLDLSVIPCGGVVEVEVATKEQIVASPKRVEGFGKILIPNPLKSTRYYIKIFAMNREELKKLSGVEVYITVRSPSRLPLPNMPQELRVHEYPTFKTCNSVTIGWLPASGQHIVHYCLVVKEGKIRDTDDYTMPNQCGLDNRLKKSVDAALKYCIDVKVDERVVIHKIKHLKPGRFYIIQVTVKKPKGKTLSYHLLQVNTKPMCSRHL